jgi:hypothetical protein
MANKTGKGGFKDRPHDRAKGRPPGVKNKNYADISHWLHRADIEIELEKNPEKRVSLVKWATELIMGKIPILPATPGDSLSNAIAAQTLVKALESDPVDLDPVTAPRGD